MITFDQFIQQRTGKPIDFDGIYPNQCMDLMHQYVYDVMGITNKSILAHPYAYQVYTQFTETQYFDRIANTPNNVPQKGDIFLFGANINGGAGHVCIVTEADVNTFKSFDANFPTGSLPHIQTHNYNYALGWLRPKAIIVPLTPEQREQEIRRILGEQMSALDHIAKIDKVIHA